MLSTTITKWKPTYDLVDQLAGVEVLNAGETAILKSYGYGYDQAGSRTTEQVGNHTAGQLVTVTKAEFNAQNQLTDRQNSGAMPVRFAGTVNEPAKSLTINGTPATIRDDQSFVGWTDLSPGNNAVTLQATDYGDNAGPLLSRTVTVLGGVAKVPGYDSNGNMTTVYEPGTGQTTLYTYDGEDRLVQVVKGGVTYTLTYDGLSRMRRLSDGTSTKSFMWLGSRMAEERDATGATVVKQYFGQGVRDNGVNKFYTFDHLGSIRELVGANGSTVLARYEYDPYGRRTRTTGTQDADFGFTGHYYHAPTGLHLALYRAYDADLGRWLNRDPIGEAGGINLYGYVGNNPVNLVDPDGLFFKELFRDMGHWLYDKMMGDREGSYDQDGNMAQQAAMLGYDEADTLRNAMGEGAGILGDQGTDYAAGAGAGKLLGAGFGIVCSTSKAALKKPSLSAVKAALEKVHAKVGKLPKGKPGRFGSPQAGDSVKGYRLDPPHPSAPPGSPEAGYHINWWDYSGGKRGRGGSSGAIAIQQ